MIIVGAGATSWSSDAAPKHCLIFTSSACVAFTYRAGTVLQCVERTRQKGPDGKW
jgi:hypothetical protein